MTTATPAVLKGLSERQLAAIEVIAKYNLMLDIAAPYAGYVRGSKAQQVSTAWPEGMTQEQRSEAADAMRSALRRARGGSRYMSYSSHDLNQMGTSLLKKGLLVEVAEVRPERKDEQGSRTISRVARYALNNSARAAVGSGDIDVALDVLRAKEKAAIAREQAWNEALEPLRAQNKAIVNQRREIRYSLSNLLTQDTTDGLVKAHAKYRELQAELNELNALKKVVSDQHGREYQPFTE